MKRLHVHVAVEDLDRSIGFYSTLFATEPTVVKPDYARWMLDDPRVNFSISARGRRTGVDHLGIQAEDREELAEIHGRLQQARAPMLEVGETTCCYARSEKSWVLDPEGVAWEAFFTHGEATVYGEDSEDALLSAADVKGGDAAPGGACCPGDAPRADRVPTGACC